MSNSIYDSNIPLFQRLEELERNQPENKRQKYNIHHSLSSSQSLSSSHESSYDTNSISSNHHKHHKNTHDSKKIKEKKDKNAPASCRSNRPVPILREGHNLVSQQPKFADPRFSDATGKLNYDKFMKHYSFLDDAQENEVAQLERRMKKMKNVTMKEEMKKEVDKSKQQMTDRRRKVKVHQSVRDFYAQENEKVKEGKKPFFLKKSAIKDIALTQRYEELKKQGKLNHFLAKKRKHNASKDHRMLPRRSRAAEAEAA